MAEGKGEGQVAIVEYRQEGDEEVPTLMLIKEGFEFLDNIFFVVELGLLLWWLKAHRALF